MLGYILRRFALMGPTLLGILTLNFLIVQLAPGGPVEQMIAKIQGMNTDATARFTGSDHLQNFSIDQTSNQYKGARGLDPAFIKELERMYGFDKPLWERYWILMKNYATFDFGKSYFRDRSVLELIKEKLPVSISLGLWTTLLIYLISIPLGIAKARKDGSAFDIWSSAVIVIGYAIPGFLFAILLIVLFAGGSYFDLFPLRGLLSDNWTDLSVWEKIKDYFWHITLPVTAMVISGFASLTLLTKNSFVEEINKQYVLTARAKGLTERSILYRHIFRNAMLVIMGGIPAAFLNILFTGALLIEVIFSLDGLGLLSFEAAVGRDYPVMFGSLFILTCVSLIAHLLGDLVYMLIDPRIDFEKRTNS